MSLAGILASSLFSGAGSLSGHHLPSSANGQNAAAQSTFNDLQRSLSANGAGSPAGVTPLPSRLTQLGQDLKTGDLRSAQADFSAIRLALEHGPASHGKATQPGSGGSGFSTAAMQAYGALQSPLGDGWNSLIPSPAGSFAVDA
jgi:hypothetical protein